MPQAAREAPGRTGAALIKAAFGIGDAGLAQAIEAAMRQNLAEAIWQRVCRPALR